MDNTHKGSVPATMVKPQSPINRQCIDCKCFQKKTSSDGTCKRYPKNEDKRNEDWCFEFRR